jgi:CheY-like chemotaxis protein
VLDLAKMEAGRMQITPVSVDPRETLQIVFAQHQASAAKKRLEFTFNVEPDAPTRVKIDSLRLSQITGNLLSNALKFTAKGAVTMELAYSREGESRARLILHVRDTGIGLKEDQLGRIFDKFTQADSSITRNFGGTGLGLAISRQLAELMGGTLEVSSRVNEGTCFTLCVPVEVMQWGQPKLVDVPVVRPIAPTKNPLQSPTRKVLLAEDIVTNQELMIVILSRMNCEVKLAKNGFDAVALAKKHAFSCILMDCQMPVMDGYEATQRIRANELAQGRERTPIIALTANAMSGAVELCIAAGMDDYISKPFNSVEFWRVFDSWVQS